MMIGNGPEEVGLMDLQAFPLIWAQTQAAPTPAPASTNSTALLALRRWFGGLTLSSPQALPDFHPIFALLAALAVLLAIALLFQGPLGVLKQLFDLPGHIRIVQDATRRVWRAGRLIAILIGFTVLGWTGSQALNFMRNDDRRGDLTLLTKSRSLPELAFEQGVLAGLTPLRDVAALGDNLTLVLIMVVVVFRASLDMPGWAIPPDYDRKNVRAVPVSRWSTAIWGAGSLYALYRAVGWGAGNGDLPLGGCLVVEAALVPIMMIICDGFLLAWVLTELRNAGLDLTGEDRLDIRQAIALMPAAALACVLAFPARYAATFVWLSAAYFPTWVSATPLGAYVRWQLGWGLTELQTAGLAMVGFAGVVAWSRGTIRGSLVGFRRLLGAHGGHLVVVLAMAGVAAAVLAGSVYAILLLLPSQNWVLAAADSYAHYVTLPVGLWVLAAVITLAERTLPSAEVHRFAGHSGTEFAQTGLEDDRRDAAELASAPTS
jgi:energy-converting hydrogenase Eha subunit A